ncbi:hypothetical protein PUNSTDRAFT_85232, partial [Punctularia strigosozonata HHB-11173 SS5]|uniref:uncharacterized protein n=1 Tax=Punctularia strigosozonata (strain HHB-11173) TaxID=741275 RepID=UPI00044168EB
MNGVRRLFTGASSATTPDPPPKPESPPKATIPLVINAKPSWPPSSPSISPRSPTKSLPGSPLESPKTTTAGLFLRKDKQRPPAMPSESDAGDTSFQSRPMSNAASSFMSPVRNQAPSLPPSPETTQRSRPRTISRPSIISRKLPNYSSPLRPSSPGNSRDELLISLLASEAVVESRDCEILPAEEVEELKKEQQILSARLGAMNKKLMLETKIRDAAASLSRVNASYKKMSKQTEEQLEASEKKVESAQKEVWRVLERLSEVNRRLYEHRAGVLSFSVRSMENKLAPQSNGASDTTTDGRDSRSSLISPTLSSVTSVSTASKNRFDGAHLFAGHADAVVPQPPRAAPSLADVVELEEKLKAATQQLGEASRKQAEMGRELSLLRLEKEQVETSLGMELQGAEETIDRLEKELKTARKLDSQVQVLLQQQQDWQQGRTELERKTREVDVLERRLELLEEQSGEASELGSSLARAREENDSLRRQWDEERITLHKELDKAVAQSDSLNEELSQLKLEMQQVQIRSQGDGESLQMVNAQLDECSDMLRALVKEHNIILSSGDFSSKGIILSIGAHLEAVSAKLDAHSRDQAEWDAARRKLQEDLQKGLDKREDLARDVEQARQEREEARREIRDLEARLKEQSDSLGELPSRPSLALSTSTISMPSTSSDGDASKMVSILLPIWNVLPSPEARAVKMTPRSQVGSPIAPGSPSVSSPKTKRPSLSDLDVRTLKSLYDSPGGAPRTPVGGPFSIESFASRVQALIADDRALIERLVRFAQAHDLLKKNAERAQKLALESNAALETYQKQVKTLEERNMSAISKLAALEDEVQRLQDAVDRIETEKRDVEALAAEQAQQILQLTEANTTLSARTLSLAEEVTLAGDGARKQMEAQLAECKKALKNAEDEIEALRTSDQSQRIQLLDEMTTLQTENENLRAQLRSRK